MALSLKPVPNSRNARETLRHRLDSSPQSKRGSQGIATPIAISRLVDGILEVGRQRKSLLSQLRSALESGDNTGALKMARELCGLSG